MAYWARREGACGSRSRSRLASTSGVLKPSNPAAPRLFFQRRGRTLNSIAPSQDSRGTQRGRILGLLIGAKGGWVPLIRILELGVAQYNARLFELRRLGFQIENRRSGEHSAYRLVPHPRLPIKAAPAEDYRLFPDDIPDHLDLG